MQPPPRAKRARTLATLLALATLAIAMPAEAQAAAQVTLEDQATGGQRIVVATATLPGGGFVTIHDSRLQDGAVFASVIAVSAYLEPGTHTQVAAYVDEPLDGETTVYAMPHRDTDGDGRYRFISTGGEVDGPYTAGDAPGMDEARVTWSARVAASDQPTDGASVLIDEAILLDGGFIAVHDATLLEGSLFDSVLGTSPHLAPGRHVNVRVPLEREVQDAATLYPMAHQDTDGDATYDFVTSQGNDDGPYTHGADPVMAPFTATPRGTACVEAGDQPTGGNRIAIDEAYLPDGGFVTIHDATLLDGAVLESVLGTSAFLAPGLHKHFGVELDKPYTQGDVFAMAHKDTNGNQAYDFVTSEGEDDGPYLDGEDPAMARLAPTLSAAVHVHPFASDGTSYRVAYADLSQGGFIAVHDGRLLVGQVIPSVVGHSGFLPAGLHKDLAIDMEPGVRESGVLVAMPHRDTDGDRTYGFVTSGGADDGPYTADGPVMDDAYVTVGASIR